MDIHNIMIAALLLYIAGSLAYFTSFSRAGAILVPLGIALNAAGLFLRGRFEGAWFPALWVDGPLIMPIFLALISLSFFRSGARVPGRVTAAALVLCSLAAFIPAPAPAFPSAKTGVALAPIFFLVETSGIAFFITGGFLALAALLLRLDTQEAVRRCVLWGFILFTTAQVLGAVWSFVGWSFPFSWSPRHLASACLWCLYAALLHAGSTRISFRATAALIAMGLVPVPFILYTHQVQHLFIKLTGVFS